MSSELFNNTSQKFSEGITIIEQIGQGLVPLIEEGKRDSVEMENLLQLYLKPMIEKNIDYLVLGCSHYPFLIPQIRNIVGKNVTIIDSGEAVARQTKAVLEKHDLLNNSNLKANHELFSNSKITTLKNIIVDFKINCSIDHLDF